MKGIKFLCADCDEYFFRRSDRDQRMEIKDDEDVFLKDMQYGLVCTACERKRSWEAAEALEVWS